MIGGGPAGTAAAHLLARWGHAVSLVTRPPGRDAALAESLPPSTRKLLDLIGGTERLDAAGVVRATGNTVWWGRAAPRIERFADGRGWQVTSDRLEAVLHETLKREAGVELRHDRVTPETAAAAGAAFVLDCSGRAGVLARARGVRRYASRRVVALAGVWRADAFDVPDETHTLIESYDGGWVWSVPTAPGERHVAVMVDPRTSGLTRDVPARDIYLAELARTTEFRRVLAGAALAAGPHGWDATVYDAERYVLDNVLLVGDAAVSIDPLSSAGVKKALASGWLAAVAVHTSLLDPSRRAMALSFYDAREREVAASFDEMTRRHLAGAAGAHAHPFWVDRAAAVADADEAAALAAAFEHLRAQPDLRLARHPAVRIEARPAVRGREIVREPCLVHDEAPAGVRFIRDVDLLLLVQLAPVSPSVPALFASYCERAPAVALPDFLYALSAAIAGRWLRWV